MRGNKKGGVNTNFRQTPKEFKSLGQEQTYQHINENLPYKIFRYTKSKISSVYEKIGGRWSVFRKKLPDNARRMK